MITKRIVDEEITLIPFFPNEDVSYRLFKEFNLFKEFRNTNYYVFLNKLNKIYNDPTTRGECFYIEYRGIFIGVITLLDNNELRITIYREYQNKHIGKRCIENMIPLAKRNGGKSIKVNLHAYDELSKNMFLSLGFIQTSEKVLVLPLENYSSVRIETTDLILKKARFEDWEDLYNNIWCHPESAKYMLWNVTPNAEAAKLRMQKTISYEKIEKYALIIYLKETSSAIGWAAMRELSPHTYEEAGIAIGPKFVNKGYGKQILNALVMEAKKCGAKTFLAGARTQNLASHYLQMSCGFEFSHYSEEKIDPRTGENYIIEYNIKAL